MSVVMYNDPKTVEVVQNAFMEIVKISYGYVSSVVTLFFYNSACQVRVSLGVGIVSVMSGLTYSAVEWQIP